jgi:sortase (surface protein transpeptidase)
VLTVTAVQGQPGHWTAYTGGAARPAVSTLNLDTPGQTRANQAIVAMNGTNRTIDVYSLAGGHLLVDVVGWFTGATASADTAGLFVPTSPIRMLDTRILRTLAPWARSTYEFTTANPTAQVSAVALNVTALNAWDPGFVTALPAGLPVPGASNLNLTGWQQVTAAHAIVAVSTRGAALYTSAGAHLVADVAGWYLGTPTTPTRAPQANPTFNPNPVNSVYVPSLGVFVGTRSGPDPDAIVDQGYAAVTGSLLNVANVGNVMLFAHRTSGTAPFRYLNQLQVGGEFSLVGADGHWYHYKVVRTAVTTPDYSSIAGQAAGQGSVTAQLIACSRSNGTPGGTSYRIVVTGRLVSVS